MLEFYVLGEPVAAARSRFGRPARGHVGWYTPGKTADMVKNIRDFAAAAIHKVGRANFPLPGPIICGFRFELATEGLNFPLHGQKPDLDNLEKTVLDGLRGTAIIDDAQVVGWMPFPYHGKFPAHPRDAKTYVRVMALEEYQQKIETICSVLRSDLNARLAAHR